MPARKRRHQKSTRFSPILLEPLEQRQLLTALPTDPLAVSSGSSVPSWFTVYNGSNMTSAVIAEHALQTIPANTVSGATSYVYNAVSTTNSVQQQTVQVDDNYYVGTGSMQFGLQARTNSSGTSYYALETSPFSKTGNGSFSIVKVDSGVQTMLATYQLSAPLSPATVIQFQDSVYTNNVYNMKFLVQTDAGNTSLTDLKAEVWLQGTSEPAAWQLSTTDGDTNLQGAGYGGIMEIPSTNTGDPNTTLVSGYAESTTGDPATITNFTASPTDYTGSYPVTVTFNASATYAHGSISDYTINFGDGASVTTTAVVNLTHSYTAAPSQAFTAMLTVTDSSGGTIQDEQVIAANTSVSTDPTGTLSMNRNGGNGISGSNPLEVHFMATGTPHSGDSLAQYILNFGDGTYLDMPTNSSTSTLDLYVDHFYTSNGTFTPTLTLVGNDGATSIITQSAAPTLSISSTPPTVTTTFNTSTDILKAIFSQDVGAVQAGQVDSNDNPLGEPLWTDGAYTSSSSSPYLISGAFAGALDVRNDNSGGSVSVPSAAFSYSNSTDTATWNLSTLVNTTSTSYTATLFANEIEDQAGNYLDGTNSGLGGNNASLHFGATYPNTNVSLFSGGSWNAQLVFAPSIANDIQSLATTTIGGVASTTITFTGNGAIHKILAALYEAGNAEGSPVIIEDMASGFTSLDGLWFIDGLTDTNTADSISIPTQPYTKSILSTWAPNAMGSMHISPETSTGDYDFSSPEFQMISDLEQITNSTISPITNITGGAADGVTVTNGIYVGAASQFDTSTIYDKTLDENQLNNSSYIVRSDGTNVYLVGANTGGENDAIDAFLQSLGMQEYGPSNTYYTASNTIAANIWQVTPSLSTISTSWDIHSNPTFSFMYNSGGSGGNTAGEQEGWDTFFQFNFGGGSPVPNAPLNELSGQANLGIGDTQTNLDLHPDWWASGNNIGTKLSGQDYAATFMPLTGAPINVGDTFEISLKDGSTKQTLTYTAVSSDVNNATQLVKDIVAFIDSSTVQTNTAFSYFWTSSIVVTSNNDYNVNVAAPTSTNPVVEIYDYSTKVPTYTVTAQKNLATDSNFAATIFHDSQLNFANPGVVNQVVNTVVANDLAGDNYPSGSVISLSAKDGPGYDQSEATQAFLNSNNPFYISYASTEWQGYNQNGILADAVAESYWTLVNDAAKYLLQNEAMYNKTLYIAGLSYASTSQTPTFKMEPNVIIETSEIFQYSGQPIDEQLKDNAQNGALTGLYRSWDIFLEGGYGNPGAPDLVASNVSSQMTLLADDHVFELEGENAPSEGGEMPGYYMVGLINQATGNDNPTTMQTDLSAYYNSMFGPAATDIEDYSVLFNGTAADPNLASPPAQVTFNGYAFGAFGEPVGNFDLPAVPASGLQYVASDELALQQAFTYVNNGITDLANALGNGSINTSQFDTYQARLQQVQMYDLYLFDEYKVEADYFSLGTNTTPTVGSQSFNLIMNDLTNVATWADDLVSTDLINTTNFDVSFQAYAYGKLKYFWNNDPNGSNGVKTEGKGLLNTPSQKANPTQATVNSDWTAAEAVLDLPSPPINLTATVVSSTENDLAWTNTATSLEPATGIDIYRSTDDVNFTLLASKGPSATSYHDTTASNGTTNYYYEILSFNATTTSAPIYDGPVEATAPAVAAPTSLSASAASSSQINLSWTDNSGGTADYNIDRSTNGGVAYTQFATVAAGTTTYSDTGLTASTTYYYEVQAFNGSSVSAYSNAASATTSSSGGTLGTPSGLTASAVSSSEITLSWTDNSDSGATGYNVDRSTTSSGGFTQIATVSGASADAYTNTGLSEGVNYYYEVEAFNGSTTSGFSNIASAVTILAAPSGLSATGVSSSQINLSWTDNDGGAATSYDIDRSTTSSGGFTQIATVTAGATAYTNTGLSDGTQYFYEVQAADSSTTSAFSNVASAITSMNAPSALSATAAGTGQINLSWTDNDSGSATSYDIDRSTTSSGGFSQIATVGSGATAYTNTGLSQSTNYFYEVDAVDAYTTSAFSNVANAITNLNAPSGLTATAASSSQINLSWTDNDGGAATSYNIDRSTNGSSYGQIATVGTGATAYTDSAVFPSTTYYYEVQAVASGTSSAFSSSANATTPTNEVGGVVTDNWYGSNGSAWSSQWTQTSNLTNATASTTINASDQGQVVLTKSGGTMSGKFLTNINTVSYEDSFQSVLISANTTGMEFDLVSRATANADGNTYFVRLTWASSGSNLEVYEAVGGTGTPIKSYNTGAINTNTTYDMEFEVVTANSTTTDLYAKVWATSSTEPTTWQINTKDSTTSLQGLSGSPGMRFFPTTGTTNTFTVDNYEAVNLTSGEDTYIDNFQNSSTTGWTPLTASRWSVGSNGDSIRYYINATSYAAGSGGSLGEYSLLTSGGPTNVGDFTITVDVAAASSAAGSNYAIVFGYQNSTNYYFMEFNATSGDTALYKVVSGTASVVASASGSWITDTAYHAIKIQRTGTSISVWYDGNSVLSTSDSTFVGGEIGLGAINDSAYFDNVIIG